MASRNYCSKEKFCNDKRRQKVVQCNHCKYFFDEKLINDKEIFYYLHYLDCFFCKNFLCPKSMMRPLFKNWCVSEFCLVFPSLRAFHIRYFFSKSERFSNICQILKGFLALQANDGNTSLCSCCNLRICLHRQKYIRLVSNWNRTKSSANHDWTNNCILFQILHFVHTRVSLHQVGLFMPPILEPSEHHSIIVWRVLRRALNWSPIMPSDTSTESRCKFFQYGRLFLLVTKY